MKPPACQFYFADFLIGTMTMSAEEAGGYMRLLCYQWDRGSVPDDDAQILRLAGCSPAAIPAIRAKFVAAAGELRNERMERERQKQADFRAERSQSGQAGAKKRWGSHESPNGSAIAQPSKSQWQNNSPPSPSPSPSPSPVSDLRSSNTIPAGAGGVTVKDALQVRVSALFRRRPTTPWAAGELRAWKTAEAVVADTTPEDWATLERWYAQPAASVPYRKTDMAALLNNWHAEITKATKARELNPPARVSIGGQAPEFPIMR